MAQKNIEDDRLNIYLNSVPGLREALEKYVKDQLLKTTLQKEIVKATAEKMIAAGYLKRSKR